MDRTILIVDDEDTVRDSLRRVLEREGYKVLEATNGEAGLALLKQQEAQVLISDYNMPGMSGIDFLKLVRERHPEVLRIMLTADPNPETIIRSINEGEVYRFIRKPWDSIALRVTIYFAFETCQLEAENRKLLAALRRQLTMVKELQKEFPYLTALARDEEAELLVAAADLAKP